MVLLDDDLSSFDPSANLELRQTVRFDCSRIRTACGLSEEDRLGVVALWLSRLTTLARVPGRPINSIPRLATWKLNFPCPSRGGDLGGTLVLRTVLMLTQTHGAPTPLIAHVPGSILWEAPTPEGRRSRGAQEPGSRRNSRTFGGVRELLPEPIRLVPRLGIETTSPSRSSGPSGSTSTPGTPS